MPPAELWAERSSTVHRVQRGGPSNIITGLDHSYPEPKRSSSSWRCPGMKSETRSRSSGVRWMHRHGVFLSSVGPL